jgi:hypothetical protein
MDCVIVNSDGDLYAGFEEGKPRYFRTKRDSCVMDEALANTVLRQLHALGFTQTCIRPANGVIRKWVPSDHNAAA